jgi:hypothetical protein
VFVLADSFNFIEAPGTASEVLDWFRSLAQAPEETQRADSTILYFKHIGPLDVRVDEFGRVDGSRSPVVHLVLPKVRRSILWTNGAVVFLSAPARRFPELAKIKRDFAVWLSQFPVVYSPTRDAQNEHNYHLEGGVCEAGLLYALPTGMEALSSGQYFVGSNDTETRLETVCRALRLRGLDCGAV